MLDWPGLRLFALTDLLPLYEDFMLKRTYYM